MVSSFVLRDDHFCKIARWYDTKGALKGKADVTVFGMK